VKATRSQPRSASYTQAALWAKARKGSLRSPDAWAQRMASSTAARKQWICSRRAMRPLLCLVMRAWKR
jgi:hypothetical protein